MVKKLQDPMEPIREIKRRLSAELDEAHRFGKLAQKMKEYERRHAKLIAVLKKKSKA